MTVACPIIACFFIFSFSGVEMRDIYNVMHSFHSRIMVLFPDWNVQNSQISDRSFLFYFLFFCFNWNYPALLGNKYKLCILVSLNILVPSREIWNSVDRQRFQGKREVKLCSHCSSHTADELLSLSFEEDEWDYQLFVSQANMHSKG